MLRFFENELFQANQRHFEKHADQISSSCGKKQMPNKIISLD